MAGDGDGRRPVIRNRRDFVGGLVLTGISVVALWSTWHLPGMNDLGFGSGTTPRLFAGGLCLLGAVLVILSFTYDGPAAPTFRWRGPFFVTVAVILFALTVRPWGLVFSAFSTVVLAAAASDDFSVTEALVWSAVLTLFCVLVFPYGLGLPLQLWPR